MGKPLIEASKISKVYRMGDVDVHALRDVSLTISEGDRWPVMDLRLGQVDPDEHLGVPGPSQFGWLWLGGDEVSRPRPQRLGAAAQRTLGFVFQSFNPAVAHHLRWRTSSASAVRGRVGARAPRACARGASTRGVWANACTTIPIRCPGGQQQRVAVARALVHATAPHGG